MPLRIHHAHVDIDKGFAHAPNIVSAGVLKKLRARNEYDWRPPLLSMDLICQYVRHVTLPLRLSKTLTCTITVEVSASD